MSDTICYAGFVRRAGALFIDSLAVSIPGTVAHFHALTTGSIWGDLAIESLVWLPYYVLFTASPWQATPGKRAFGIKVTDLSGARIGYGRSTVRYLATFLSAFALTAGYLMVLFTPKRQALHDLLAGTVVVSDETAPGALPPDGRVMPLHARTISAAAACLFLFLAYVAASGFLLEAPEDERLAGAVPAGVATGQPHRLGYALYKLPFWGGPPELVKEGTLAYQLNDVRVLPGPSGGRESAVKRLAVVDGFALEAHIHREAMINGFALTLEKGAGSSWEWFDLDGDYVFRKRLGNGRIQARLDRQEGVEEIGEILFLEDVTLSLDRHWMIPFARGETEHLVVKKGSVLALK